MTENLKVIISTEIAKLKQGVSEAKRAVDKFTEGSEKGASEMDAAFKKAGDSIKTSLTSAFKVGATALAGLGTALAGTVPATEEFRVNMAKLTAGFEQAGMSADEAKGIYSELFAVIGESDQATEAANNIALLASSEEEAARWAELASGVVGTFHDTLQPEAFYEAANETLKLGEATGAYAQMLEQTGVMSVEEFNKQLAACKTEQEKNAFMLSVSEKAMGKAGESYDKSTEAIQNQRKAQVKLQESLAKIATAMQPVITAFTELLSKGLEKIEPYVTNFIENYGPALKEVLSTTVGIVKEIIGFIVDNWEIIAGIAAVIGGITVAIGLYNTVAAVKAAMAALEVTTVWALVAAYVAQAAAMIAALAPYLLIVAAIAAVIAIIVLCVKHWDEIKEAAGKAVDFIKGAWEKVATWFDETIVQPIKNAFTGMWDNLKNGAKNAWTGIKNAFGSVATWFKDKFSQAWNNVKNIFSTGGKIFTGLKEGIANVFKSVVNGIIGGINKAIAVPFNAINKMLNSIRNAEFLGIAPFKGMWKQNPLSVPEIPKLARGGIVDSATIAMIGEQGKEAIVPLENTEWIDKLASKINTPANSKPVKVILNVDGKAFAETSISTINDLTRQTGSLKLNLM
jgi:hypothetical protein